MATEAIDSSRPGLRAGPFFIVPPRQAGSVCLRLRRITRPWWRERHGLGPRHDGGRSRRGAVRL